jgi:O-antigen/teichoic acid export membrane protein
VSLESRGARVPERPALSDGVDGHRIRKQIRGSTLLLLGRVLSLGVMFAIQVTVVRHLSKESYGAFAYCVSLVAIGQTVVTFGLDRATTRFVPIYDEQRDFGKVFGTIALVLVGLLTLGSLLIGSVYAFQGSLTGGIIDDPKAVSLLLIMVMLAPLYALDALLMGLLSVFSRPRAIFFRAYVVAPALRLSVVLLLVIVDADVMFLASGYVAAEFVGVGLYTLILVRALREEQILDHFELREVSVPAREIFALTLPMLAADLLYAVIYSSDAILLAYFHGSREVADFRVVQSPARLNELVHVSFLILFTPVASRLFARRDYSGLNNLYWQTAAWIAVISFPVCALTFVLARPVTETLYGSRYADSAIFLSLLSVGYYVQSAFGFNGTTLMVAGKVWYLISILGITLAFNIAASLLLIPHYGSLGAAISTSATLVVHNILKQVGLRLAMKVRFFELKYLRVYASVVLGLIAAGVTNTIVTESLYAGLVMVALVSLAVVVANHRVLAVAETFPEFMRFPVLRRLFSG